MDLHFGQWVISPAVQKLITGNSSAEHHDNIPDTKDINKEGMKLMDGWIRNLIHGLLAMQLRGVINKKNGLFTFRLTVREACKTNFR